MTQNPAIYALMDPKTEEVRYIGKANNPQIRLRDHVSAAQRGKVTHKANWIRQLLQQGLEPVLQLLEVVTPDQDWQKREQWWIRHGRDMEWPLTNATDGGEGTVGYVPTPETRAKLSAAKMGQTLSEETRAKISAAGRGRKHTAEARAKIGAASKERIRSKETRAKICAALKGRTLSEEHCANISAALTGRTLSEKHCANLSAAQVGHIVSEETRVKLRGENNSHVVLTEDRVREIRRLYTTGNYTQRQLAVQFNVGRTTIGHVVRRETWKHI